MAAFKMMRHLVSILSLRVWAVLILLPACDENTAKCDVDGETFELGQTVYLNEAKTVCECTKEGFKCAQAEGAEAGIRLPDESLDRGVVDLMGLTPEADARTHQNDATGTERDTQVLDSTPVTNADSETDMGGVPFSARLVDSPGYGDSLDLARTFSTCVRYIDGCFRAALRSEQRIRRGDARAQKQDKKLVDVVLYFFSPHRAKEIDMDFLRAMRGKASIVPVLAKADTMTTAELQDFRATVTAALESAGIEIAHSPFAVVCAERPAKAVEERNARRRTLRSRLDRPSRRLREKLAAARRLAPRILGGGGGASVYSTADDAQKLERARVADDLAAFDDALRARDDAE